MPGPPPKDSRLRQRTNRKATAARISTHRRGRIPELPDRPCPLRAQHEPEVAPVKKRGPGRPRKPRPACSICLGTDTLPWHPLTMAWWREVWTSEVADQYLHVDRSALVRLAVLVDSYWRASDVGASVRELGAEIRLQQQAFGLTPLDRARLQWEIERAPSPAEAEKEAAPPIYESRDVLRALK